MDAVIEDIEESETINLYDLSSEAVDDFIVLLQQKKRMSNNEVTFFRGVVERAKLYGMHESLVSISCVLSVANLADSVTETFTD